MRDFDYTDSELWTMNELDRLFWIEIAKRRSRLHDPARFGALLALREEMEAFFSDHASQDDSEVLEDGADRLFDVIQFDPDLPDGHDQLPVFNDAMRRFRARVLEVADGLQFCDGFKWADFAIVTDLAWLNDWWNLINSGQFRSEMHITKGKFSTHGDLTPHLDEDDPGTVIQRMSFVNCPIRMPTRVGHRPFDSFNSDEHDIQIDGMALQDKLVIVLDLKRPLPPGRTIEAAAIIAHRHAHTMRELAQYDAGIVPDSWLSDEEPADKRDVFRMTQTPPAELVLVKAQNNVTPLITGLFCWDLVHNTGLAATAAYKQTAAALGVSEKQATYALCKVVKPRITAYQAADLPWV